MSNSIQLSSRLHVEFGGQKYPITSFADASEKLCALRDEGNFGSTELAEMGVWPLCIKDSQRTGLGR